MPGSGLRVVGAGICCVDYLLTAPRAEWGGTVHATDYRIQGGGLVGTALVAAARLGARAAVATLVGDDEAGAAVLRGLRAEGVGTRGAAVVRGGGTPFSFIHVDARTGERTIFHRPAQRLRGRERRCDLALIRGAGALLVDDYYPALALAAARRARAGGVPVVGDFLPGRRSDALAAHVDALVVPRHFLARGRGGRDEERPPDSAPTEREIGAGLEAIHRLGPSIAVITLGAHGWAASDARGRSRGRAFRVRVVDTTGAGDVFHGAFAYGLARGWETPRCCEFAAAVAALKCAKPGGRTGIPTLGEALAFLRRQPAHI